MFKFTRDGKLLMTLGKAGVSMAGPDTFVAPTDVVVNARGEIFVADGHTPRPGSQDGDRIVKLHHVQPQVLSAYPATKR